MGETSRTRPLKMINARVETVTERPAFRRAVRALPLPDHRRRLLRVEAVSDPSRRAGPAARSRRTTSPAPTGEPFAFAGLWSIWRPDERLQAPLLRDPHDRRQRRDRAAPRPDAGDPRPATPSRRGSTRRRRATELLEMLAPLPSEQTALRPVGPGRQRRPLRRARVPRARRRRAPSRRCSESSHVRMALAPLLAGYDNVMLDLDGCVWVGDDAAPRGAGGDRRASRGRQGADVPDQRRAPLARGLRAQALVARACRPRSRRS